MINTPAFESFQRYRLLRDAAFDILEREGDSPYNWLLIYLKKAKDREEDFMEANKEKWIKELNK